MADQSRPIKGLYGIHTQKFEMISGICKIGDIIAIHLFSRSKAYCSDSISAISLAQSYSSNVASLQCIVIKDTFFC